ncbi:MAG: hypothetical protein WCO66_01340 [Candidatus Absconditabacteria bacterium]
MKTDKVKMTGKFYVDEAVSSFGDMKNGEAGYIEANYINLVKYDDNKALMRIHLDAPLWTDEGSYSMLFIEKNNDTLFIDIIYDDRATFDKEITDEHDSRWSEPIEVSFEPYVDDNLGGKFEIKVETKEQRQESIVNSILGRKENDLSLQHDAFVDYCYSRQSTPDDTELAFKEIKKRAPALILDLRIDTIHLIRMNAEELIDNLQEKEEDSLARFGSSLFELTPQMNYLNEYFHFIRMLCDSAIECAQKVDSYEDLEEDELLKLFHTETDPTKKDEIGKILSKRY